MTLLELDQKAKYHYSRLELQEAMMCYAQAFTEYPNLGLAYNNYGNIMREVWMKPTPHGESTAVRTPSSLVAAMAITGVATVVIGVLPGVVTRFGDLSDLTRAFGG